MLPAPRPVRTLTESGSGDACAMPATSRASFRGFRSSTDPRPRRVASALRTPPWLIKRRWIGLADLGPNCFCCGKMMHFQAYSNVQQPKFLPRSADSA